MKRWLAHKMNKKECEVDPMISVTKIKRLIKEYCACSYKKKNAINANKLKPESLKLRENFTRLFI